MSTDAKFLDWLFNNCRIVYYPTDAYPIEHAPAAKKDSRAILRWAYDYQHGHGVNRPPWVAGAQVAEILEFNARVAARRFGAHLAALRERAGLSQSGLARRINVSQSAISQMESADRSPTYGMLVSLADGLGVQMSELVSPPPPEQPAKIGAETIPETSLTPPHDNAPGGER